MAGNIARWWKGCAQGKGSICSGGGAEYLYDFARSLEKRNKGDLINT